MWVEFFCSWFAHWLREVFLRVLRFSPLLKNQHFLISSWPGIRLPKNYLVDILPLNRYFFLFFYLISFKLSLHFIVYYVLFFPPKNVSFSDVVMTNNGCHYKQVDRSCCFPSSPQSSRDVIPGCSVHYWTTVTFSSALQLFKMMSIEQSAFWFKNIFLYWPGLHHPSCLIWSYLNSKHCFLSNSDQVFMLFCFPFRFTFRLRLRKGALSGHLCLVRHSAKHNKCGEFPS